MSDLASEVAALRAEIEHLRYAVAHDLRAPLRAVVGYAAALDEDFGSTLDVEAARFLGIVATEAARAMEMLDGLLELSRLSRVGLVFESIDMTALAREVAAEISPLRDERIRIDSLPAIDADRALVRTMLKALLANAVIATDGVSSAHIAVAVETSADRVVFSVTDTGIGFDPKYRDKLFRPFAKLHHAERFPGVGVGLAIVDRIARRHGGTASGDARPAAGAVFSFALPRRTTT